MNQNEVIILANALVEEYLIYMFDDELMSSIQTMLDAEQICGLTNFLESCVRWVAYGDSDNALYLEGLFVFRKPLSIYKWMDKNDIHLEEDFINQVALFLQQTTSNNVMQMYVKHYLMEVCDDVDGGSDMFRFLDTIKILRGNQIIPK